MKIRYYIPIFVLIGFFLYIARDDVKTAYDHVRTSIDSALHIAVPTPAVSSTQTNTLSDSINTSTAIVTPGPLRVTSNFLQALSPEAKLTAQGVITLTNQQRQENGGLPPLVENATLNGTAEIKLQDMFTKQYFAHVSPSGVGVQNLADQNGYQYIVIGENLALGNFNDDAALVAAWMASPGHRANILNTKYTEIGVAVGEGMFEGKQTWLAVQHFGLPRSACPALDEVLHGVIDADQTQLSAMSADMAVRRQQIDSGAVYNGMTTNEQITAYNTLVQQYNILVTDTKTKINKYNTEVAALNACIANDTAGVKTVTE
jgi:uncharacterized protein YkwD